MSVSYASRVPRSRPGPLSSVCATAALYGVHRLLTAGRIGIDRTRRTHGGRGPRAALLFFFRSELTAFRSTDFQSPLRYVCRAAHPHTSHDTPGHTGPAALPLDAPLGLKLQPKFSGRNLHNPSTQSIRIPC